MPHNMAPVDQACKPGSLNHHCAAAPCSLHTAPPPMASSSGTIESSAVQCCRYSHVLRSWYTSRSYMPVPEKGHAAIAYESLHCRSSAAPTARQSITHGQLTTVVSHPAHLRATELLSTEQKPSSKLQSVHSSCCYRPHYTTYTRRQTAPTLKSTTQLLAYIVSLQW